MRVSFRQGIVSHQTPNPFTITGGNANIIANDRSMTVSIAHRDTDYIHSEDATVTGAWSGPFDAGTVYWLYWDFNSLTFARTFGVTTLEPIYQATEPTGVADGQMWYDTSNHLHYEYVAGSWAQVLRVFAAKLVNSVDFIGMSAVGSNFAGSQISDTTSVFAGRVLLDQSGRPILRTNKTLFTTEDEFFTNQSRVDAIRLESNVTRAVSLENVAEFTAVAWTADGKVTTASYDDVGSTVVGIMTEPVSVNETGAIITQGSITNPDWNWTASVDVGAPLWVGAGVTKGLLITTDPHLNDPITYNVGQVPVARVLSADTIIFEQGLGGKGDTGPTGPSGNSLIATTSSLGSVLLHTEANNPGAPEVITDLDPRLSDSRAPLAGSSFYVNLDGDTMTDLLVLSGDPAVDLGAATKQYVDNKVLLNLTDLTNVVVAGSPLVADQILTFDGTNWINAVPEAGSNNWIHANGGVDFDNSPDGGINSSLAIGNGATVGPEARDSIAIGTSAYCPAPGFSSSRPDQIAIGRNANSAQSSVALGASTNATGTGSVAIGNGAWAGGTQAISIGQGSAATSYHQIAIGQSVKDTSVDTPGISYSTKIGEGATGANKNLLHLFSKGKLELYGDEAQFIIPKYATTLEPANPVEGSLIYDSSANALKAHDGASWTTIGNNWIHANNGANFGNPSSGLGVRAIAIGDAASVGIYPRDCIAIGTSATVNNAIAGRPNAIAIGVNAFASQNSVSLGSSTNTTTDAIAIGSGANGSGTGSISIGASSTASAYHQVAIGRSVTDTSVDVPGISYSAKLGQGATGANKNLLHLFSKGKLELYGEEAMYIAPSYVKATIATIPANAVAGGMIYVSDATGASVTGSICFYNGTSWIDVTTGVAVV